MLVKKLTFKSSRRNRYFFGTRIRTLNERNRNRMNNKIKLFSTGVMIFILLLGIAAYFYVEYASAEPIRVACVGDSITEGSGYPFQLNLMLGSNYIVGNFGVSGSTV